VSTIEPVTGEPEVDPRSQISRRIVQLLKEFSGKGPVKARTYLMDDVVLVVLGGSFTAVETTLDAAGQGQAVRDQRAVFQETMRVRFSAEIERILGRKVISFMSASDQAADRAAELFILEPQSSG
jgi:uncharacterized protein YbcI